MEELKPKFDGKELLLKQQFTITTTVIKLFDFLRAVMSIELERQSN